LKRFVRRLQLDYTKSKGIFRVSIVMPCLNEERFIGQAIESLVGSESAGTGSEIASAQERLAMTNMVPDRWPDSPDRFRDSPDRGSDSAKGRRDSADSGKVPAGNVEGLTSRGKSVPILDWELIVVDGGSTDRTREVVREYVDGAKAKELGIGGRVRLIDNPGRLQSHGLNAGIKEARGEIIVRADAHCVFPPRYVRRCVELLEKTGAANVGGVMVPVAERVVEGIFEQDEKHKEDGTRGKTKHVHQAIALALQHPVGVGDAKWHVGKYRGYVDTVYLGTFRREVFEEVGFYDPNLKTNEDGELNLRILKAGKRIYLDSSIRVAYFPRETLGKLAKQYFHYGKGRCYTTLKHRKMTSWRQAGPVALVAGLAAAFVLSLWRPAFLILPAAYVVSLPAVALLTRFKFGGKLEPVHVHAKIRLLVAAAWAIMHVSWGLGFWSCLIFRR